MDAYNTDVRPLLAELREEMGLAPDPYKAYLASGYGEKIIAERVGGDAAGVRTCRGTRSSGTAGQRTWRHT